MRATGRHSSRGVSLIELMISLVIGLIVVAGLVSVLMANRQAYSIQQDSNFNQENLRFGTSRLAWSLRMADFWGGVKPAKITPLASLADIGGAGDCNAAWVMSVGDSKQNGIWGYSGADKFPVKDCVDDANYVKQSDVVVVRYADTHGYDPAKSASTTAYDSGVPNATGVFLVSSVGEEGALFRTADAVPASPLETSTGRYVYPYQIEMYYLRPCADPGKDGVCGTNDDGDADARSPTLVRMRMDDKGALVSEAVVDGIEQLQFEYASPIPLKGSAGTPTFRAASALSTADWATVTQVRMALVTRSQARDTALPHSVKYRLSGHCAYSIGTDGVVTYPSDTPETNTCADAPAENYGDKPQQFVRNITSQVVLLRNRVRG